MRPLIVIDVQNCYRAVAPILPNVLILIEKAKKKNNPIVVLRCRETPAFLASTRLDDEVHKGVLSAVAGYDKIVIAEKYTCCGGSEVWSALWELCWQRWEDFPFTLTACGVNTEACVAETVNWLAEVGFEVILTYSHE